MVVEADVVRFVCISDNHNRRPMKDLPPGDVLLHAGDFTSKGTLNEAKLFNEWLGTLHFQYKVVIPGNHDLFCDARFTKRVGSHDPHEVLSNAIYLQDSSVTIMGIKIYGAPWQPVHFRNAFTLERGKPLQEKWSLIPEDTTILITHGPPYGHGDKVRSGDHVGCFDLILTVQNKVKPKYHVFGHIHEGYGATTDGTTTFINAAVLDRHHVWSNSPIVFDLPLPDGIKKEWA
ncbi:unnamed protein product, partial [Meganyctiphanes norvegica]